MNAWLHVDLDAFFASVEQLDNPELRGKPVIIGGLPGDRRSVVSTASYEARKFGVHSAMPSAKAFQLCPQGIFISGNMHRYLEKSAEVMAIFSEFSPDVQQMSVDEAFIDLTGTERLFGPPEETALKLKKRVKEITGLTVSVGLATNKYIAKIASGYSKPDGFFKVDAGMEQAFMLSLPLKKVWGIGNKTLERLTTAGFMTTAMVHKASLPLLKSLFGEAGANFLYTAVRGGEAEIFSSESKTHSISAETTFPYDITDLYTAETTIMELSYSVMFRMIKEEYISRTVHIKIRYDDFSVKSAQDTSPHIITSSDSLFERASSLFRKTRDDGRGIRLLGVGVFNLERNTIPQQAELFDFDNSAKKQAVEKAVFSMKKKDPEIKISKARLIKKQFSEIIFLFFILLAPFAFVQNATSEENNTSSQSSPFDTDNEKDTLSTIMPESSSSLFSYSKNDKDIEFLASGDWESSLSESASITFKANKTPTVNVSQLVFTQTVDISVWFLLNDSWYFEAAFSDGFERNTVAAGYYGDGIINHVRVANRGITFPTGYPDEITGRGIGGGQNESPGVSAALSGSKWQANFAVRYDIVESHEKTFSGMNELSKTVVALSSWKKGRVFILPSAEICALVDSVYIEYINGPFTDKAGRHYRKLDSSEYMVQSTRAEIILAEPTSGAVCISFSGNNQSAQSLITSQLGCFADGYQKDMEPSSFLGRIQFWFSCKNTEPVELQLFSYGAAIGNNSAPETRAFSEGGGYEADGFFTTIGTETVLAVQNPPYFSPFVESSFYDSNLSSNTNLTGTDIGVISQSTGIQSSLYDASILNADSLSTNNDFFTTKKNYIELFNTEQTESNSNRIEINPRDMFPLADYYPNIYLLNSSAASKQTDSDLAIQLSAYTNVPALDIGTDAIPGTITIYRDGTTDSMFSFDSETGIVTLLKAPGAFEQIRITWLEESSSRDNGSITAGAGFRTFITDKLTFDSSLTTRWNYSPDLKFTQDSETAPGFANTAARISYSDGDFAVSNTVSAAIDVDNLTGTHVAVSMDSSEVQTVYLTETSSVDVPSSILPELIKRQTSTASSPILKEENRGICSPAAGKQDSGISGWASVINWDFTSIDGEISSSEATYKESTPAWCAMDINLGSAASSLRSASQFSIALKDNSSLAANSTTPKGTYEVYLQLGVQAVSNRSYENQSGLAVWKISKSSILDKNPEDVVSAFIPGYLPNDNNGWQTVTISLHDTDKAKLELYQNARIIIIQYADSIESNLELSNEEKKGELLAGSYEINGTDFSISSPQGIFVSTFNEKNTALSEKTEYAEKIIWQEQAAQSFSNEISISKFISGFTLSSYKQLEFSFEVDTDKLQSETEYISGIPGLKIIFDRPESTTEIPSLEFSIPAEIIRQYAGKKCTVAVDLNTKKASINGDDISACSVIINSNIIPTHASIVLTPPAVLSSVEQTGAITIGEILFLGTNPAYSAADYISLSWKKDGSIITAGNFAVLSDVGASVDGMAAVSTVQNGEQGFSQVNYSASGTAGANATIAGLKTLFSVTGGTNAVSNNDGTKQPGITQLSHSIATDGKHIIFRIISFSDDYSWMPSSSSLKKANSISFSLSPFDIPFSVLYKTEAESNSTSLSQKANASVKFDIPIKKSVYSLEANGSVKENIKFYSGDNKIDYSSYGSGFSDMFKTEFSIGNQDASNRTIYAFANQSFSIPVNDLKPSASISATGIYNNSSSASFTDSTSFAFSIPFTLEHQKISLSWSKKTGAVSIVQNGGSYSSDADKYIASVKQQPWIFSSLPIYDLFDSSLYETIGNSAKERILQSDNETLSSLSYNSSYSLNWSRPFSAARKDLYIPSSLSIIFSRDIAASSSTQDIHQIKGTVGFTALNSFGSFSKTPLFSWFEQDEITHSWSITLKFNGKEAVPKQYLFSGYIQTAVYTSGTDNIKAKASILIQNGGSWKTAEEIAWDRKTQRSPITDIIRLFASNIDMGKLSMARADGINFAFQQNRSETITTDSSTSEAESTSISTGIFDQISYSIGKYVIIKAKLSTGVAFSKISEETTTVWDNSITISGKISF